MAQAMDLKANSFLHTGRVGSHSHASSSCYSAPVRTSRRLPLPRATASQEGGVEGGLAGGLKRVARQIQGALPIVGLLSRLGSPSGGVGNDMLSYPEYCRRLLYDAPSPDFLKALADWERAHGKVGQRRFVLLFLYMAMEGGGVVSGKAIMSAARRLRVTQDIEIEVERFENARDTLYQKYGVAEKPKGKLQDKLDIAVDAVAALTLGLREGEEMGATDAEQLLPLICGAFGSDQGTVALIRQAIETRGMRKQAYAI